MNIVLIGYRGAGKSVVGRRLAERLGRRFFDTDDLIEEQQGVPISEIVKAHGWPYFRSLEQQVIRKISTAEDLVLAPGGGAVLDGENRRALKRRGLLVWLKADPQVLWARVGQDPESLFRRPGLAGRGDRREFEEIMRIREPLYAQAADVQVDTSKMDVEGVVRALALILQKKMGRMQVGR